MHVILIDHGECIDIFLIEKNNNINQNQNGTIKPVNF